MLFYTCTMIFGALLGCVRSAAAADTATPPPLGGKPSFLPVATQFSPVPSGNGWKGERGALSEKVLRDTVDNMIAHGFTGLELNTHRPAAEQAFIRNYARSRGMFLTAHAGALEGFGRDAPPDPSVYSKAYATAVRKRVRARLANIKDVPGLYNAFTYQDEPFHWGPQSFGYSDVVKAAFKTRYGYDLPPDLNSIRDNPRKWLDVINFRSDNFPVGWRQVYRAIKDVAPNFKVTLTHDSHNTFGAGYSSHAGLAIDDVFHWGGDFADMFVFDIYPYMMFDFRFGQCSKLPKPRISQTHYAFAQMRAVTRAYDKQLGFWVGTYNPAWFRDYLCPQLKASSWSEREMSATAVAQGANFLLTGYKIPIDPAHWDSFGEGLRLLQKAGGRLLNAPKVRAKACMLFPRTHYIQMQEEFFNVGLSFELFLRAFGELDVVHEEQITRDDLNGYKILVLFDVKLLPKVVARHIAAFVRSGGIIIADCVPNLDAYKRPLPDMEELFGVTHARTDRIVRSGHWVPCKTRAPYWANRPKNPPDETAFTTDRLQGKVLGQSLDLPLISPRPSTATRGTVLLTTASGAPGIVHRKVGAGHAFLLGFCLQDTYFKTWQEDNPAARAQLRGLLRAMTRKAGICPHVWSSNPDIEASIRANARDGFLLVINHEARDPNTSIELAGLPFQIARITDLDSGKTVPVERTNGTVRLRVLAPLGQTRLLHVLPVSH